MAMHLLASLFGWKSSWTKVLGTFAIAFAIPLAGCDSPDQSTATGPSEPSPAVTSAPAPGPDSTESPEPSETSQVIGEPVVSAHELIPGRHCYALESDVLTAAIGMTVTEDDRVVGESQGTIHNEPAAYFSSYGQTFEGVIAKDQLTLELTSYIEGDIQEAQETWTLGNDQLNTGRDVYDQVDCSVVQDQLAVVDDVIAGSRFSTEAQLEPATAELNDLTDAATNVRVQRLSFASGAADGVIEDGVVRAERNQYLVGAAAGQTMALSISALENNAAFGLVAPDGSVFFFEETNVEVDLPQSGDYSIVVGGTRGNASYRLTVEIR